MKLRAGWGMLGNQEIGDYTYATTVNYGFNYTYGYFGNQATFSGGAPTSYANKNIKWEATKQTNIGLDMNLF
ncbi:MAG: TonB-dependent receptor [Bacteroidales bacterium]|nr:TonB-dependent receptor [Bacteroidales bacterium]